MIVVSLNGNKLWQVYILSYGVGFGELLCKAVGNSDISRFLTFHDVVKCPHYFVNGSVIVPHMVYIQIPIVHTEMPETRINTHLNVLSAGNTFAISSCDRGRNLVGNHHILTFGEVTQGTSYIPLTGAVLWGLCPC